VEFANQRLAEGKPALEAMLEAGRIRLRPILMTAVATIAGTLPIVIGLGEGGESRRPLGVATLGGMTTSTFLTLFVIPVAYVLLSRFFERLRARGAPRRWGLGRAVTPATVGEGDGGDPSTRAQASDRGALAQGRPERGAAESKDDGGRLSG